MNGRKVGPDLSISKWGKEAKGQSNTLLRLRDIQVWTVFSAVHSLRDKTDIFVEGGLRWGRNATGFIYERLGGGVAFTPRKYLTLGPRYSIVETEPTATQELGENRLGLESTFTASLRRWTISDRNVIERRFRQPRDSTRYRNRLRLERAFRFSRASWYAFVSDELYHDNAYHEWNRNRFQVGGGESPSPRW